MSEESHSHGARLVSTDGRVLPLAATHVRAEARGGVARAVLEQTFQNPHAEPLVVTYSLPLPAEGAVSGFAFTLGDRRVVGEVDRKHAARARYEQALAEGRGAALLEQDRSSLFTQEIGNIPPGGEVVCEITIDQRLRWLDEGAWEWRFPTVVAPRYLGAPGRVPDAAHIAQDVADGPLAVRMTLALAVRDELADGRRPESPSHPITARDAQGGGVAVGLEGAGARLDRDVVVRWLVAQPRVGLALACGRGPADCAHGDVAHALLTVVPPDRATARKRPVPRDLIVLLDTSGSMSGEPIAQARRVVAALVETLTERDRLEMIEFSSAPRRWRPVAANVSPAVRRDALAWLDALRASGGTEMRAGILEALRPLRADAQRQIVLVTDGLIGFESEVVAAVCDGLPRGSRLHTVGVGSSVNRSLTGPAARAGHGVEVVIGLGEDPERAARRLVARTDAPVLVDLELGGSALLAHVPIKLPDLFAGAPALVSLKLAPEGGEVSVRGRTADGSWEQRVQVPALAPGEGSQWTAALFAREAVEDLETRLGAGAWASEVDPQIERFGLEYQIATRLTSWVAVTREVVVDPRDARRRERMPHELPHGMSAEGLGLRPALAADAGAVDEDEEAAGDAFADGALFSLRELSSVEEERAEGAARAQPKGAVEKDSRTRGRADANESRAKADAPPPPPPQFGEGESKRKERQRAVSLPPAPARPSASPATPPPRASRPADAKPVLPPAPPARRAESAADTTGAMPAQPPHTGVIPGAPPTMGAPMSPAAARGGAGHDAPSMKAAEQLAAAPSAAPSGAWAPPGGFAPQSQSTTTIGAAAGGRAADELDAETAGAPSDKKESGGGGLLGAIKRVFGFGREAPSESESAARVLRGQVTVQRDASGQRTVIVTAIIDPAGELAWEPALEVEVEFADGTRATARVDLARTTQPARLAVGQTVRVTLALPPDAPPAAPRRIVLRTPAGQVIIAV